MLQHRELASVHLSYEAGNNEPWCERKLRLQVAYYCRQQYQWHD